MNKSALNKKLVVSSQTFLNVKIDLGATKPKSTVVQISTKDNFQ
ncbi:hypothetical protein [Umezakia ovalisporum]|uniref:Uncharacterized protein n=2 Tax=Umezakia ovalisporum TaxID=75695 RepID=A0AA43KF67_9CYAN|nr:hypothetical protein [Umezakia ovalisporum]MDH6058383.1 hypothetical protein [Umezakia ovalisporum FSS-43]MDH6063643.1 hypothetical protein [Umezakia ovalisporum FSS-62]MDH6068247.1 hypothetical protein [Umezakia ovalisporum APH033B]MDH6069535.1 hypothetical protein [Umezakia ovalisporum CobakiLakeA]MDH6076127.1 hypothetical protein [Umezakia ovalisporum CS-1034]